MNKSNYNKDLKQFARALRKNSTKAEIRLWTEVLRARKMLGFQFNRQRPVHHYIADFMCNELKLIIEVDGYTHEFEKRYKKDLHRQSTLEKLGYTVLRFTDEEVMEDLDNVERVIEGWVKENGL